MEQLTGSILGKKYDKGFILSPCLFNLHAEYIMRNAGLDGSQTGIKISGRNVNNLKYADDNHSKGRKWENDVLLSEISQTTLSFLRWGKKN